MAEDLQAIELQKIYQQADAECKKKIVEAAAQLLDAQKSLALSNALFNGCESGLLCRVDDQMLHGGGVGNVMRSEGMELKQIQVRAGEQ